MKNYLTFILAILLIFTGCGTNIEPEVPKTPVLEEVPVQEEKPPVPEKPVPEEIPPIDFPEEEDIICREILFCFGAMENAYGDYITPKGQPTAFDCGFSKMRQRPRRKHIFILCSISCRKRQRSPISIT